MERLISDSNESGSSRLTTDLSSPPKAPSRTLTSKRLGWTRFLQPGYTDDLSGKLLQRHRIPSCTGPVEIHSEIHPPLEQPSQMRWTSGLANDVTGLTGPTSGLVEDLGMWQWSNICAGLVLVPGSGAALADRQLVGTLATWGWLLRVG